MIDLSPETAEAIARAFHENYERLAPEYDYKTREASAVPWADVPEQNRQLMVATVSATFGLQHVACVHPEWDCPCGGSDRLRLR